MTRPRYVFLPSDWPAGDKEEDEGPASAEASDFFRFGSDTAGGLGLGEAGLAVGGGARPEEKGGARVEDRGGRGLWIPCTIRGVVLADGGLASEAPPPPPLGGLWELTVVETNSVPVVSEGVAGAEEGVVNVACVRL